MRFYIHVRPIRWLGVVIPFGRDHSSPVNVAPPRPQPQLTRQQQRRSYACLIFLITVTLRVVLACLYDV
jgi:hypothetical protein